MLAALPAAALAQDPQFVVRSSPFIPNCAPAIQEFCRAPIGFNSNDAAARLLNADLAFWTDGETLNVVARSSAHEVQLTGTIDDGMYPLSVGRPYWGAAYRLPKLDQSIVELKLKGAEAPALVWRGKKAPEAPPANDPLKGRLEVVEIKSAALSAPRKVSIYVPSGAAPKGGWPAVIAADGDAIGPYVAILDALIERGEIRPTALVAPWSRTDPNDRAPRGPSSREYIRGADADSYGRHVMFVMREVLPLAQNTYGLSVRAADRMLFGHGNGADWALETAARNPDSAQTVAAFSVPGQSEPPFRPGQGHGIRVLMAAGLYEGPFLKGSRAICNLATASGAPCTLDLTYAGHAPLMWQVEFAKALRQTFPKAKPDTARR
jgi:enterochelin esterase-like enzyme